MITFKKFLLLSENPLQDVRKQQKSIPTSIQKTQEFSSKMKKFSNVLQNKIKERLILTKTKLVN
jgi:hypothetical protein